MIVTKYVLLIVRVLAIGEKLCIADALLSDIQIPFRNVITILDSPIRNPRSHETPSPYYCTVPGNSRILFDMPSRAPRRAMESTPPSRRKPYVTAIRSTGILNSNIIDIAYSAAVSADLLRADRLPNLEVGLAVDGFVMALPHRYSFAQ